MAAVRQADLPTALGSAYNDTFRKLMGMFRARGMRSEDAADLAQEAATRVLVHLSRHGITRTDLRPLIVTIARNLLAESHRSASPNSVELVESDSVCDDDLADTIASRQVTRRVHEALNELSERHRRALSMWLDGHRPPEIASELGIKRNAADALLHRARRQLAQRLDDCRGLLSGVAAPLILRLRRRAEWAESAGVWGLREQIAIVCAVLCAAAIPFATSPSPTARPTTSDAAKTAVVTVSSAVIAPPSGNAVAPTGAAARTKTPTKKTVDIRYGGKVCADGPDGQPADVSLGVLSRDDGKPSPVYELVTKTVPVPEEIAPYIPLGSSCKE